MNAAHTKRFSWKKAFILSFAVGLLSTGVSIFAQSRIQVVQGLHIEESKPAVATSTVMGFGSSFEAPGEPVRLRIPVIEVDANIQSVGLSWKGNGEMDIPTNFADVAWYNQGPRPSMPGSAVINGHFDGKDVPKAVFYNLNKLAPGDVVEVEDKDGSIFQFKVVGRKTYNYDDSAGEVFYGDSSRRMLNLITCSGDWVKSKKLYAKRIVVFTELITTN